MITIRIQNDTVPPLGDAIRNLGWRFATNNRGIPDRIYNANGNLVAFNNTKQHVELEFVRIVDARNFLMNVEELPK